MFRRSIASITLLSAFVFGLGSVRASEGDDALQTYSGFAGKGLVGVGAESPGYDYYIELDRPMEIDGTDYQMLLTNYELPVNQPVTVCGRVEIEEYNGVETHYAYAALKKITSFEACE